MFTPFEQLQQALQADRLAHAYLLTGRPGAGKRALAMRWAQTLLCDAQSACGHCQSCHWFEVGTHPDFMLLEGEGALGSIKIEPIRTLSDKLSRHALRQGYQVVVIPDADRMTLSAANALLKCLEEPRGAVQFLLLTAHPSRLLPTIRSRMQVLPLTGSSTQIQPETMSEWQAQCLEVLSGQCDPVQLASQIDKGDETDFIGSLIPLLQDLIRLNFKLGVPYLAQSESSEILSKWVYFKSVHNVYSLLDKVLVAYDLLEQGRSLNKQLILEDVLIQFFRLGRRISTLQS